MSTKLYPAPADQGSKTFLGGGEVLWDGRGSRKYGGGVGREVEGKRWGGFLKKARG